MKVGVNLDIKPKSMSKFFLFVSFLFSISIFSQQELEIDFKKLNSKVSVFDSNYNLITVGFEMTKQPAPPPKYYNLMIFKSKKL